MSDIKLGDTTYHGVAAVSLPTPDGSTAMYVKPDTKVYVQTVNGISPDENGNVEIPMGGTGLPVVTLTTPVPTDAFTAEECAALAAAADNILPPVFVFKIGDEDVSVNFAAPSTKVGPDPTNAEPSYGFFICIGGELLTISGAGDSWSANGL